MSIYNNRAGLDFKYAFERAKGPAIALGALIAVVALIWLASIVAEAFRQKQVTAYFEKQEIMPSEQTKLFVTVTNTGQQTANNVLVEVTPIDKTAISVFPSDNSISVLGAGESRTLELIVNPVGNALPGSYKVGITVEMHGKKSYAETIIRIVQ